MHSCRNIIIKHWKAILIYGVCITAGILIALWFQGLEADSGYRATMFAVSRDWFAIAIIFSMMAAMVIAGYFMGRKYE
jgi:prolipoprotein diacylglyceryltransferase